MPIVQDQCVISSLEHLTLVEVIAEKQVPGRVMSIYIKDLPSATLRSYFPLFIERSIRESYLSQNGRAL